MKRLFVLTILVLTICAKCAADPTPQQITTTSWHGLSGLFVIPTARLMGDHNFCVGFNESKHTEFVRGEKFTDRQIRGVVTWGISETVEVTGTYFNDMYIIPPDQQPQLNNQTFYTVGLKVLILKEHPYYWFPAVAVGFRDLTNNTADVGPLRNVNNGTKVFVLASKRLLKNETIGRFMDVHAGLTFDHDAVSGLAGFELTLAANASLIAEGIWDSPYLNFRNYGENDQKGRFLFNTGLRIYPELVPGLVLDLGFVGDSEFEFSFGISYKTHL